MNAIPISKLHVLPLFVVRCKQDELLCLGGPINSCTALLRKHIMAISAIATYCLTCVYSYIVRLKLARPVPTHCKHAN
jgi:hypothetical protein